MFRASGAADPPSRSISVFVIVAELERPACPSSRVDLDRPAW